MSQQPLPSQDEINSQVTAALAEDLGGNADASADITANLIPASQQATATIITNVNGSMWHGRASPSQHRQESRRSLVRRVC